MEELNLSADGAESLFQLSGDLFAVTDSKGKFSWISPGWKETLGWDLDLLQTKPWMAWIYPEDRGRVSRRWDDFSHSPEGISFLTRMSHYSGGYRHLEWRVFSPTSSSTLYWSGREVTVQVELDRKLTEKTKFLHMAEDMAALGHWQYVVRNRQWIWSEQILKIHGQNTGQDSVGGIEVFHPDDRRMLEMQMEEACREKKDFEFDLPILKASGEVRIIVFRGKCEMTQEGEVQTLLGVFQDITQIKHAEEALRRENRERIAKTTRLRELHRLTLISFNSFAELYQTYLTAGCETLGMGTGIISRILEGNYKVLSVQTSLLGIKEGAQMDLADTYCRDVVENKSAISVHHAGANERLKRHPVYQNLKLESYLGAPIWVEGKVFGTLSFSDLRALPQPFAESDVEFVSLMARTLGAALEKDLRERERLKTRKELQESQDRFFGAFENAPIGMALVGLDGKWLQVNRALCEIVGYSEEELLRSTFQEITHPDDLDSDLSQVKKLLRGEVKSYKMEKRYFHKSGSVVWIMLSVSLVHSAEGLPLHFVSQIQDITENKAAREKILQQSKELEKANTELKKLSRTDALTGLFNRRALTEKLENVFLESKRYGYPLSIMIMDVDRFKEFNDEFGHPAGDQILIQVGEILNDKARQTDFVSRYGGEEFVVVLPHTDREGALTLAERCRQGVENFAWKDRPITASFGIVTFPRKTSLDPGRDDIGILFKEADRSLYHSKREGRNRVTHVDDLPPYLY